MIEYFQQNKQPEINRTWWLACCFAKKKCSAEITAAWLPIFQLSMDSHTIPALWKKSMIIPVPKVSCPSGNNDFRPVALTCGVMKCFERVIVNLLKTELAPCLYNLLTGKDEVWMMLLSVWCTSVSTWTRTPKLMLGCYLLILVRPLIQSVLSCLSGKWLIWTSTLLLLNGFILSKLTGTSRSR